MAYSTLLGCGRLCSFPFPSLRKVILHLPCSGRLWGFHFMQLCERFVLFLTRVLKARTGTVLRVICISVCRNTCMCTLLLPHLQVFNDILWRHIFNKSYSVFFLLYPCWNPLQRASWDTFQRGKNVDSAFSFNLTHIL